MRMTSKLLAGLAVLTLIAVSTGTTLADPPRGVSPRPGDVVGVSSDTIGYLLDQFSHDYNKTHPKASSLLYSWDATNPVTGRSGGNIMTKASCGTIVRPDGSPAGIAALEANVRTSSDHRDYCLDFAGSSAGPSSADPPCASGGICFIPLAGDAVTWASRDAASGGTDAPASLTIAELSGIYECKITNWRKVGGRNARIRAFLPQTSSGTRASWLTALGITTPGTCVSDGGNALAENQGISPALDSPEVIVPYSVAAYIAQAYHDARCARTPIAAENLFGCDEHGVLGLGEIGGSEPVRPWPLPRHACEQCAINPEFTPLFQHPVYIVVRYASSSGHIPAYLDPFFGPRKIRGWVCTSPTASADIANYGFLVLPASWPPAGATAPGGPLSKPACGTPYV